MQSNQNYLSDFSQIIYNCYSLNHYPFTIYHGVHRFYVPSHSPQIDASQEASI